ncbi:hypothetical protein BGW38_004471 [Lunasporangiospora selenospora]|uniref:Lon protease homolog n=1 Tax=Lunasporangiospora selenospora TaxID=979761 RepID=A0A9P6FR97_9FUNG|nr:hypothetical protein BGW38_004471 [Lunasporangiospora selenospora]
MPRPIPGSLKPKIPTRLLLLPLVDRVLLPGVVTRLQLSRQQDPVLLLEHLLRTLDSKQLSKTVIGVFPIASTAVVVSKGRLHDHHGNNSDNRSRLDNGSGPKSDLPGASGAKEFKDSVASSSSDEGIFVGTTPFGPVHPDFGNAIGSSIGPVVLPSWRREGGSKQSVPRQQGSKSNSQQNNVSTWGDLLKTAVTLDPSDLHPIGCAARLVRLERIEGGFVVVLEGLTRLKLGRIVSQSPNLEADIRAVPDFVVDKSDQILQDQITALRAVSREYVALLLSLKLPMPVLTQLQRFLESVSVAPGQVVDLLTSSIEISYEEKLAVLNAVDLKERIAKAIEFLAREVQVLTISQNVHTNIEGKLTKKQRELYLRQQLNAIREELGEKDLGGQGDQDEELLQIDQRLADANLPSEVQQVADRELKRMSKMLPASSEYNVIRSYLDWLADLPWSTSTHDYLDVERARRQLDADHFGLEKVKKRILEYLAVTKLQQMRGDVKAPILCLVGPPGVGKTSLGRSIAAAMGRMFHRISLGGIWDEAEIRGHRRTYVGALPGIILNGMKKCEVNNPVFLLDEIDKLGSRGHRGDPSAAFLEVLDPEQNSTFTDHYLNIPFDLSKVLFIATANSIESIPGPLLDRMEVITISGYTFAEKLAIARHYLVPKQIRVHGLNKGGVQITESALVKIATGYTRESGVRQLEREIASVVRAKAVEYAEFREQTVCSPVHQLGYARYPVTMASHIHGGDYDDSKHSQVLDYRPHVLIEDVETILGQEKYVSEVAERIPIAGVVTGLVYNGVGGGVLFVEASQMPGRGLLQLTGSLGGVIKESAHIALSWIKSHGYELGLTHHQGQNVMEKADVHIHLPCGSIPKDGPSAGITLVCALVSMFTNHTIPPTTAMTGEFTLRGLVMPVGGIKEKVIAAHRAGVRKLILSDRNRKDVMADVPANVQNEMVFIYTSCIWEVLQEAFERRLVVRHQPKDGPQVVVDSRL